MVLPAEPINNQLERCSHCGSCMSVCPVYRETGEEAMVARGKLTLIEAHEKGHLASSGKLQQLLQACLLCGACAHQCASGVRADLLIQRQRSRLGRKVPVSWRTRLTVGTLEAAGRWPRLVAGAGSLAQALLCKEIPAESGLHLRFPLQVLSRRHYLPRLTSTPFLAQAPGHALGSGPRVGLFVGCVGNYLYPEISDASVELLRRSGFQVVIPPGQQCCGMPAWASGDMPTAQALARHNSLVFQEAGCEWVVSGCGSCSTQLRLRLPELLGTSSPTRARFFATRSMDLVAFVVRQVPAAEARRLLVSPGRLKVSYHDPCHLLYHQRIFPEPRQLLSLLPGVNFAELPGAHQCCGHGGLFNVSYFDLSMRIADRKMAQAAAAAPDVLATGCMGCLLQLHEGKRRRGLGLTIRHLVEVLLGRVGT